MFLFFPRTFLSNWILAPRLFEYLFGRKTTSRFVYPPPELVATLQDLRWTEGPHWVSLEKCVSSIGTHFNESENQFVRYLNGGGRDSLSEFYRQHRPSNSFEYVFLTPPKGYSLPEGYNRQPWAPEPAGSLSPGHQYHGPTSEAKLDYETWLLESLRRSISKRGLVQGYDFHQPLPRFQLLVDDVSSPTPDWRVLVQGSHRVAVLAHLGWEAVPLLPSLSVPREIRLSDVAEWPAVVDGDYSKDAARLYFLGFFMTPEEKSFPGWFN
jgi:hypothetical protein